MGWEARGDSARKYYTRSRKRFGRVEREYVGCGPLAMAEAKRVKRESVCWLLHAYCEWSITMGELCR
jgi:hypothetical protein